MVGGAEGPGRHQRLAGLHQPQRAVDPRGLDRLGRRERRQDRGDPLGEHRLAAAGRADHGDVVAARRGHADRPLRRLLAAHVGEVDVVGREPVEPLVHTGRRRRNLELSREEPHGLGERCHRDHVDVGDDGGFHGARGRHHHALERPALAGAVALLPRGCHGDREGAAGGPRRALERELSHDGIVGQPLRRDLPAPGEDAEGDRQIERGRLLGQLRRGEIHDDPVVGAVESGVDHRAGHAVRALADGRVGHADEHGGGEGAARHVHFDVDRNGLDPEQ